jgi:hypothetical protein
MNEAAGDYYIFQVPRSSSNGIQMLNNVTLSLIVALMGKLCNPALALCPPQDEK